MRLELPLWEDIKINKILDEDKSVHDWYRFVLSFPPHLVRAYLSKFNIKKGQCLLDPFAGTGTTLVEAKKYGVNSIGVEANPVAYMASTAKIDWSLAPDAIIDNASKIMEQAEKTIHESVALKTLHEDSDRVLIRNSISPLPLHKSLCLLEAICKHGHKDHLSLYKTAFAKNLVYKHSNLKFGPEVGVSRKRIEDCNPVDDWFSQIKIMITDIESHKHLSNVKSSILLNDSRCINLLLQPKSIDAIICSPPYPNEKDYTRTTRLESVLLGFITCRKDLRHYKEALIRSNTRNVFKGDNDDTWIDEYKSIQELSANIEEERVMLKKNSGFEKLYHKVVKLYFGGMARHLEGLKPSLKKGAMLAYVVGDQASYFRIPIRTGEIIEEIAFALGYKVIGRDLFRTRYATATKDRLKEEVVLLQWQK